MRAEEDGRAGKRQVARRRIGDRHRLGRFKKLFYWGNGIICGVNANDQLVDYRWEGYYHRSVNWTNQNIVIGSGWDLPHVFSGGDGTVYAVAANDGRGREQRHLRLQLPLVS